MEWSEAERADVGEDVEQILAAKADDVLDLAPATERWLVSILDAQARGRSRRERRRAALAGLSLLALAVGGEVIRRRLR